MTHEQICVILPLCAMNPLHLMTVAECVTFNVWVNILVLFCKRWLFILQNWTKFYLSTGFSVLILPWLTEPCFGKMDFFPLLSPKKKTFSIYSIFIKRLLYIIQEHWWSLTYSYLPDEQVAVYPLVWTVCWGDDKLFFLSVAWFLLVQIRNQAITNTRLPIQNQIWFLVHRKSGDKQPILDLPICLSNLPHVTDDWCRWHMCSFLIFLLFQPQRSGNFSINLFSRGASVANKPKMDLGFCNIRQIYIQRNFTEPPRVSWDNQ